MQPRLEIIPEKKLVGLHRRMSFAANETTGLWQAFMPRRKEIINAMGSLLFSLEIYDKDFFLHFIMTAELDKWAAVEVSDVNALPQGMESLIVPAGLYAIFLHRGPASKGPKTYNYIFRSWLPSSGYLIDERPHFALMGEKYKHNDPSSEEDIFIPIRRT